MEQVVHGLMLGMAAVFATAAVAKARSLQAFEVGLVGLMPRRVWQGRVTSRSMARAVVALEGFTALVLALAWPSPAAAAALAAGLLAAFAALAAVARRRHVVCSCFGGARPAGTAEVVRTAVLALAAAATTAAAAAGAAPDGTALGGPALVVAALVLAAALVPELGHAARRAAAQAPSGGADGLTRRLVLKGMLGGAAALLLGSALTGVATANPPRSCQAQFDLCYGCTTKMTWEQDVDCCIACYAACQGAGSVCRAGISCGGCWPGA